MIDYTVLKEDITTELKTSKTSLSHSFWETYSSFANTNGGIIYLGIKQITQGKNEIVGVDNSPKMKKEILDLANNRNKVSVNLLDDSSVTILEALPGLQIIKVTVPRAPSINRPVFINDNIKNTYKRDYEGDYLCSPEQIQSMMLDQGFASYDFRRNEFGITASDVDTETYKAFADELSYYTKDAKFASMNKEELLDKLGLLSDVNGTKYLTNAGVLLFTNASKISKVYPRFQLDYQEQLTYSTKWDYRFDSDNLNNAGNLLEFYNVVLNRLKIGMPNPFKLDGDVNSGDTDFTSVLREAIVNAISNCDYLTGGIKIVRYADKMVFTNTGDIKVGLEQALKGGITVPRNMQIHTLFRRIGIADKSGTGIPMIFSVCSRFRLPEPLLVEDYANNSTVLTIFTKTTTVRMTDFDEKMMSVISANPLGISKKELVEQFNCSSTKIYKSLKTLLESGRIKTNNQSTNKLRYYPNT
ncbi:MAG: putative DNA binding domain-containing protein [Clostridia bacterium]|nr:putative DNA binding domain-containing protein [Clostridia bacterium]